MFRTETKSYNFERVEHFDYLRVTVSYDSEEELEIDKRMSKGSKVIGSLNRMLTSRKISRAAKIKMCRTVVRRAVVYGCETWVLTKKNEIKLEAWERKMLRKILKGSRTE
jgi:cob(I)alamin adenosyltransferase